MLAGETFPPEPRQARSRRSRDGLLAAAMANFAKAGYDATTIEQIAKDAGVATGGFYLHFRSKRQVLLVLVDRWLQAVAAVGSSAEADRPSTLREVSARFVRDALRADHEFAGAYRAWHELILHDAELAQHQAAIDAWNRGRIEMLLGMLAMDPEARADLDIRAIAIVLDTLFWRLLETGVAGDPAIVDTTISLVTHLLLRDEV